MNIRHLSAGLFAWGVLGVTIGAQAGAFLSPDGTPVPNGEPANAFPILKKTTIDDREYYQLDDMLFDVNALKDNGTINVRLWPEGKIVYGFSNKVPNAERQLWRDAARRWQEGTCITFKEVAPDPTRYRDLLIIEPSSFPGASITTMKTGGVMYMRLANWERRVLAHEIGHALGLIHEHQRDDRKTYVKAYPDNSKFPQTLWPFSSTIKPTDYDFCSIMHYKSSELSKTGDVLVALPPNEAMQTTMGTLDLISEKDRAAINAIYCRDPLHENSASMR